MWTSLQHMPPHERGGWRMVQQLNALAADAWQVKVRVTVSHGVVGCCVCDQGWGCMRA